MNKGRNYTIKGLKVKAFSTLVCFLFLCLSLRVCPRSSASHKNLPPDSGVLDRLRLMDMPGSLLLFTPNLSSAYRDDRSKATEKVHPQKTVHKCPGWQCVGDYREVLKSLSQTVKPRQGHHGCFDDAIGCHYPDDTHRVKDVTAEGLDHLCRHYRITCASVNQQASHHNAAVASPNGRAQQEQIALPKQAIGAPLSHSATARSSGITPAYSTATFLPLADNRA